MSNGDDWKRDEKLVFHELKRLSDETQSLRKDFKNEIRAMRGEVLAAVEAIAEHARQNSLAIAGLKVKTTMLGMLAGALAGGIPSVTALIVYILSK
jgi:hypothetical protein